jgi:hypothetical protein
MDPRYEDCLKQGQAFERYVGDCFANLGIPLTPHPVRSEMNAQRPWLAVGHLRATPD